MTDELLYDIDAESALIGSVLIGGSEVLEYNAVSYVKSQHFHDGRHRLVWQEMARLYASREPIDVISISSSFGPEANINPVFLQEKINSCVSFMSADSYANIVIEHAKRRFAEVAISTIGKAVYSKDNGNFDAVLKEGIDILDRIKHGGPGAILPWDIYTLSDAYKKREPLVYAVGDLFCLPSLNIVYGAPGCLKSMLLADMALCVSAGIPWLESPPSVKHTLSKKTLSMPVLWLDFDNGTRRTHERMDALGKSRSIGADRASLYYVSMPAPWLRADNTESIKALADLAISKSVGMIIIDNLGTVSGEADENSGDMIDVFANLRRLAEKTNSAVIVIHHQRKSTGFKSRDGESLRGHSSIEGALDLALLVERNERSPNVTIKSTKTRGTDVAPFGATFAFSHAEGTTELAGARFFGIAVEDNSKMGRARRAVIGAIEENETAMNKGALVIKAKALCDLEDGQSVGRQFIRDAVTALVADGEILEVDQGDKNARTYELV